MRLTCPCCGYTGDPEGYLAEPHWRDAVAAALSLPAPLGDRLLRYLGLFRPVKRALSPDRAARLLVELLRPIGDARVERSGRTWVAPLEVWGAALDDMLMRRDALTLPLRSHAYLYEVVAGMANAAEGRAERTHEQAKAHPGHRDLKAVAAERTAPPPEFRVLVDRLTRPGGVGSSTSPNTAPEESAP